ncbi:MAG: preprotein translocase subunit SecY [Clostridia bacterium]
MFETLRNAWKVEELRKKLLFTLGMFIIFRLGAHIPVPGVDSAVIKQMLSGSIFGFMDIISGGALKNFTVFAMGITPYINASIIIQLLTIVIPYFEHLSKEGVEGRKKMAQFTRYGAVVLGALQAAGMAYFLRNAMTTPGLIAGAVIVISLTAGTAFLMWLGELITENGIGNGISLIIFAGIVSRYPQGILTGINYLKSGEMSIITAIGFVVIALAMIVAVVAVQEGERRIPVQYAKKVVGRKVYGGQSTHIPMKVNQSGVIPIIFASSILMFPTTIAQWFPDNSFAKSVVSLFDYKSILYMVIYGLLILFFTYFYTAISFNSNDVADNMKKNGGFIPGLRPGRSTAEYLQKILNRVTFSGAIFLTIIALLPNVLYAVTGLNVQLGGTSLLIVVGVALETMKQMESHLIMRHYQGFMK